MASNKVGSWSAMTTSEYLSDSELMARAAAREEAAIVEIYRRRRPSIYRFVLHMTGSEPLAEDITQEVFLALLGKLTAYDPARGTVAAYLVGIARKHLLRHFEQSPAHLSLREESRDGFTTTPESLVERCDPLAKLSSAEAIETVRRAVLTLPPRYREAVVRCDLEEMSYDEAAAAADCAVGTIRSRLHRGRSLLAKRLRGAKSSAATAAGLPAKRCLV